MNRFKKKKIKKRIKSYLEKKEDKVFDLCLLLKMNDDKEFKEYYTKLIENQELDGFVAFNDELYMHVDDFITDENVKNNIKAKRFSSIFTYEEDDLVYELLTNKDLYNKTLYYDNFNKFRIMNTVNEDVFIKYLTENNSTNLDIVIERIKNDSILAKTIYDMKVDNVKMTDIDDSILINSIFKNLNKNIINNEDLLQKLIMYGTFENVLATYIYMKSDNLSFDKYDSLSKLESKIEEEISKLETNKDFENLYKVAYILKQSNSNLELVDSIVNILIKNKSYDYIIKSSIYLDKTLLNNFENYEDLFIAIEFTKFSEEEKEEMKNITIKDMSEKYFNKKYKDKDNDTIKKDYSKRIKK